MKSHQQHTLAAVKFDWEAKRAKGQIVDMELWKEYSTYEPRSGQQCKTIRGRHRGIDYTAVFLLGSERWSRSWDGGLLK